MAFFKEFPFTRTYDSDLAWLIRRMKEVLARMDSVEERMAALEELVTNFIATLNIDQLIKDELTRQLTELINQGLFTELINEKYGEIISLSGASNFRTYGGRTIIIDGTEYVLGGSGVNTNNYISLLGGTLDANFAIPKEFVNSAIWIPLNQLLKNQTYNVTVLFNGEQKPLYELIEPVLDTQSFYLNIWQYGTLYAGGTDYISPAVIFGAVNNNLDYENGKYEIRIKPVGSPTLDAGGYVLNMKMPIRMRNVNNFILQ